ncbi:redoxin domain-containing protein [Coraliomargarita parva]|uniref:redoxin domain-containing protein n=1 Tax=Coraliomargarita parva TaxID=3014050 RepID=UPI0022B5A390|nr:redoxin domain-containing protein [Coraliomargarita parva]
MKYTQKLLLAGWMALGAASLGAAVETGSAAPDFTLTDTAGAEHSLSDFKGKFVVLEWTNHLCPFVKKHYGEGDMQALQQEMTGKGIIWLQIVSSAEGKQGYVTPEEGEALRQEKGMHSTAMLLDAGGLVGQMYDARTTPHMYLIDPEGTLVYQGAIDSIKSTRSSDIEKATNYVKEAYESVLAGEVVENPSTSPYGCSVKY